MDWHEFNSSPERKVPLEKFREILHRWVRHREGALNDLCNFIRKDRVIVQRWWMGLDKPHVNERTKILLWFKAQGFSLDI